MNNLSDSSHQSILIKVIESLIQGVSSKLCFKKSPSSVDHKRVIEFEMKKTEINDSIDDIEKMLKEMSITDKSAIDKEIRNLESETQRVLKNHKSKVQVSKDTITKQQTLVVGQKKSLEITKRKIAHRLRALSADEESLVADLFSSRRKQSETVSQFEDFIVTARDLQRLLPGTWINDEIINFYFGLLQKRNNDEVSRIKKENNPIKPEKYFFFNTFFFTTLSGGSQKRYDYSKVRRWTKRKKIDVFSMQRLFVPINLNQSHWTLAVIDMDYKNISYYDSMLGEYEWAMTCLERYVKDEYVDKKPKLTLDPEKLKFKRTFDKDIPLQTNFYDCGVFVCKLADFLSEGLPLNYSERDMKLFRKRMALEIFRKKTDGETIDLDAKREDDL